MAPPSEVAVTTIAQSGDLILDVGTPGNARLLVSNAVLISVSDVFAALLGPHSKEGPSTRSAESPQTIPLPDDDGAAMTDMCMLLHSRPVPELAQPTVYVDAMRALSLGIVTDKYRVVDALRLQGQAILQNSLGDGNFRGDVQLVQIATTAYLLDYPRAFKLATSQLLLSYSSFDWLDVVQDRDYGQYLPDQVYRAIRWKGNIASRYIAECVPRLMVDTCGLCDFNGMGEGISATEAFSELCSAFDTAFWVSTRWNPSSVIKNLPKLVGRPRQACGHDGADGASPYVAQFDVSECVSGIRQKCAGLCLRCVRAGVPRDELVKECKNTKHRV